MTNQERRNKNLLYTVDDAIMQEQALARKLTQKLNTMDRSDFERLKTIVKELFGKSDNAVVNPPFYCDYGKNIEVGKNFFANYNCIILDVGKVIIGDNCKLGPNVAIYTAGHPLHPATRNTLFEYGEDVIIGNNVWIGGSSVICPGITIGDNVVIGAGSVVTKNIPAWTIAAGNPCKVIRKITEKDRYTYFKERKIDDEAMDKIKHIWNENNNTTLYPIAK